MRNITDEIKAVNDTSDVNTQEATPASEQTTGEVTEPNASVATEEQGTGTETEGKKEKNAEGRIKELVKERNEARTEARSLKDRLAEVTQPARQLETQFPYRSATELPTDENGNVSVDDVLRQADARAELKIRQVEAVNRINNESTQAVQKYPQLDPQSEQFDKELSDTVTEAVEAQVRLNPYSASVSKIVEKLMKPYQRAVAKEVGQVAENVAKQVLQTALRPTSVRQPEKSASDLSIAELEQKLGVVQS